MRHIVRQYWLELLVFGVVFATLLTCNLPAMTWVNTDSDGPHYILSAKYFQVAHNMSQPLFLLLGRLFLFLPFGTEAWRMGLISVLATTGCAVLIYMVVRYHLMGNPKARIYALIASLIYGGSALVISQSTIIETYALATLMSVWAYYMSIKKRWLLTSILLGIGLAVHPGLTAFCWLVLFVANKGMRHWKWVLVTGSFLLFYLYIPLVGLFGESLSMWGNETPEGFAGNNVGMMLMLAGGLAMLDLPKRILDTLGILGVSLGLGIVIVVWYYIRLKKIKNVLLWLMLLPILYFVGNLAPQCFPQGTTILKRKLTNGKAGSKFFAPIPIAIEKLQVGDEVLSYNERTGIKEFKKVTKLFKKRSNELILLKMSNDNELRCTANHPIAVNRNGNIVWLQAGKVKVGDELIQYQYRGLGGRLSSIRARGKTPEERYGDKAEHFRQICRRNAKEQWADLDGKINSLEHHRKVSAGVKRAWQNPLSEYNSEHHKETRSEYMKKHNPYNNPLTRGKTSKTKKEQWQDSEFAKKMMQSWKRMPNKKELELEEVICSVSNDFQYNGNAECGVVIGGKIPDFIDINGKKKIIELYGDYWHCGENTNILRRHYAKYGYDCLVIWEKELKDKKATRQRIKQFVYNPNVEIVTICSTEKLNENEIVYNIEVKDNHNYYAYGLLVHNCYVYLLPSIAYGAIVVGIGLSKMNVKWSYAVGLVAVVLLAFNANCLDIGRTLDPNLSAQKFYDEELPKIGDGEIYLGGGWTWAIVYLYNTEEGRNIVPVCIDILPSREYRELLRDKGIVCPSWEITEKVYGEMSHIDLQWKTALAIAQDNPNVWTSRETIPSQYECEIVPAKGNEWLFTRWFGYDEPLGIAWKPSNPYDFITGAIEVSEWKFILKSTHNCRFLLTWAVFGYFVFWLALRTYDKRKKKV